MWSVDGNWDPTIRDPDTGAVVTGGSPTVPGFDVEIAGLNSPLTLDVPAFVDSVRLEGADLTLANTLTVSGTTTFSRSNYLRGSGAIISTGEIINNGGTLDISAGSSPIAFAGGSYFENSGPSSVAARAGTTLVTIPFNHSGQMVIVNGGASLALAGGGTQSAGFTVNGGGTLLFKGDHTLLAGSKFDGYGTGVSVFDSGKLSVRAIVPIVGGTVQLYQEVIEEADYNNLKVQRGGRLVLFGDGFSSMGGGGGSGGGGGGSGPIISPAVWIDPQAFLDVTGGFNISGRTVENYGTASWSGGVIGGLLASQVNNYSGATFEVTFGGAMTDVVTLNGHSKFNNAGTFRQNSAGTITGGTRIDWEFNNTGKVEVLGGTVALQGGGTHTGVFRAAASTTHIDFNGGTHTITPNPDPTVGPTFVGDGSSRALSGTVVMASDVRVGGHVGEEDKVGHLELLGGELTGPGNLYVAKNSSVRLSGALNSPTYMRGPAGTYLYVERDGALLFDASRDPGITLDTRQVVIKSGGSANWTRGMISTTTAGTEIHNHGTFTATAAAGADPLQMYVSNPDVHPLFVNEYGGTFNKEGPDPAQIKFKFENFGDVHVNGGELAMLGPGSTHTGDWTIAAGATLAFAGGDHTPNQGKFTGTGAVGPSPQGVVEVRQGALLANDSNIKFIGATLRVNNTGSVRGNGNVLITNGSQLHVIGGGLFGPANSYVDIDSTSTLLLDSNAQPTLGGRRIDNRGVATWSGTGGLGMADGAAIHNYGAFNISADGGRIGDLGTFVNKAGGSVVKTGAGTATISAAFQSESNSTVYALGGTLNLVGGGSHAGTLSVGEGAQVALGPNDLAVVHTFNAGATVTGLGEVVAAGHLTLAGDVTVDGGYVHLTAGTIDGPGKVDLKNNGLLRLTSGTVKGTAGSTIEVDAASKFVVDPTPPGGIVSLDGRAVNNRGAASLSGGYVVLQNGAAVNNYNTLYLAADNDFQVAGSPAESINNKAGGTIIKTGPGRAKVFAAFNTDPTSLVALQEGDIELHGGGVQRGTIQRAAGTKIEYAEGDYQFPDGKRFTGPGKTQFDPGANVVVGHAIFDGGVYEIGGGSLGGGFIQIATTSIINQSGGTFGGAGGNINNTGLFNYRGGLGAGTFQNAGTVNLSDGVDPSGFGGFWADNTGRINLAGGGAGRPLGSLAFGGTVAVAAGAVATVADGDAVTSTGGTFEVGGTLRKPAGTGTASFSSGTAVVANGGTIDVQAGTIQVGGPFSVAAGTTLTKAGAGTLALPAVGLTPGATVQHNAGAVTATALTVDGGYAQAAGTAVAVAGDETVGGAGSAGGAPAAVTQAGGTHAVAGTAFVGTNGGAGTYAQTGGDRTVPVYEVIGWLGGTGVYDQSAGTHTIGTLAIGGYGGHGTYNLSGGTLTVDHVEKAFIYGTSAFNQTGGAHVVHGDIFVGSGAGGVAQYNLSAGTLAAGRLNVGINWYGGGGAGTVTQTGGAATFGSLRVGAFGSVAGTYDLRGGTATSDGQELIGFYDDAAAGPAVGTFVQSGGAHRVNDLQCLGFLGGVGAYQQTGGTNGAAALRVGYGTPATYDLGGTGALAVDSDEVIGWGAAATFTQTGGTHAVGGSTTVGYGGGAGTYRLSGGTHQAGWAVAVGPAGVYDLSGGSVRAVHFINDGTVDWSGGELHAAVTNNGTLNVRGGGTRTVDGDVTNNGTIKTWGTAFAYAGTFTNNGTYASDPADNFFADLVVSEAGVLTGGKGDRFFVRGDLATASTRRADWDTREAELIFRDAAPGGAAGTPGAGHVLSVTGADRGPAAAGYDDNFAWGRLELAAGESLALADGDDTPGGAVYVGSLDLAGGVGQVGLLAGNGLNVYYDPAAAGDEYLLGRTYPLAGGGVLAPVTADGLPAEGLPADGLLAAAVAPAAVPEPAAAGLLAVAAVGLLARRRRAA